MVAADEALQRLRDGNHRFATRPEGRRLVEVPPEPSADSQRPFAIILGCSDSRVPAEIIFDQGLGDLFVVRIAGNIVAPSQIGSIEFAAEVFATRLVVVLGHSDCGAVRAAVDGREARGDDNLGTIFDFIQPSVGEAKRVYGAKDPARLVAGAVRENILRGVRQLQTGSKTLERLASTEGLRIVGAEYCLASGVVEFIDASLE